MIHRIDIHAPVKLNLLNLLRKSNNMLGKPQSPFSSTCLINSIKHEHSCKIIYEDCSNMNASSFITFFTYMLQQNGKSFYKGLYVTFKLAPSINKNAVYFSSYSPLNEGHVSILTNSMLPTYISDIDKRIILG